MFVTNNIGVMLLFYRLIRLSSPNLNYLIGIGAIVLYIDICFFVIPSTDKVTVTVFCNVSFDASPTQDQQRLFIQQQKLISLSCS